MGDSSGFDKWFGTDEWRANSPPSITEEEIKAAEDAHIEAMHQMVLGFMFQDYCRTLSDMFCNDLIDIAEMKALLERWCDEQGMELP